MLALLLGLFLAVTAQIEDNSEFIMENAKLCGDPFSDPIWIPVLDACNEECDPMSEYCVENEDLQQQCKPLPDECKELLELRAKGMKNSKNFAAGVANLNLQKEDDDKPRTPVQQVSQAPSPKRQKKTRKISRRQNGQSQRKL